MVVPSERNVFSAPDGEQEEGVDRKNHDFVPDMPVEEESASYSQGEVSHSPYDYESPFKKTKEFFENVSMPSPFPRVDASSFRPVDDAYVPSESGDYENQREPDNYENQNFADSFASESFEETVPYGQEIQNPEVYEEGEVSGEGYSEESEYNSEDAEKIPEMPKEKLFPVPSFLSDNKSNVQQEIPPMPEVEIPVDIPEMPVGAPIEQNGTAGTFGKKKATKVEEIDEKLEEALNSTTRWFKRRRSLLFRLISTFAIVAVVAFVLFKLTLSYTSDLMVKKAVNRVNPSVAYFVIKEADDTHIRLTGLVNKKGVLIAKEVNIFYNLSDFILNKTIDRMEISGMDIAVKADGKTFSVPLLEDLKLSEKYNQKPEYKVKNINVSNSKISLYGYVNGGISFTAKGTLMDELNLSAPLSISSDRLKGNASAEIHGWAGNFEIVFKTSSSSYIDKNAYKADVALNFDLKTKEWKLHNLKASYAHQLGRYSLAADARLEYNGDLLNADLAVKTNLLKEGEKAAGLGVDEDTDAGVNRTDSRSRRYIRARRAAALAENAENEGVVNGIPAPDEVVETYPIGELKLQTKLSQLKTGRVFSARMPLNLSIVSGKWEDLQLERLNIKSDGNLNCVDGKCSYMLADNAALFIDGLKTPAFNSKFEMMEALDIKLLKSQKPAFELSLDNLSFNAVFDNADIYGAMAGVTKPNIFTVGTGNASVSGFLDVNGKYSVSAYLGGFNYSDSYYQVKNGYLQSLVSSASPMELRLKADYFEVKDSLFDIAPMAFELEAVPDGALHRFRVAWRDGTKKFSLYAQGLYDALRDRGTARFVLPPVTVGPDNKLEEIFPNMNKYFSDVSGQIAAEGTLNWIYSYVTGPVTLSLKNVSFRKDNISIEGVNTTFSLNNINPPTTVRGQKVTAASINALLPFKNVKMNLAISDNGSLTVSDFTSSLFGGKVVTYGNWVMSDGDVSPYLLLLKGGRLQDVVEYVNLPLDMSGTFDARLPLLVTPENISIALGDIRTTGAGYIRYSGKEDNKNARILSSLNYKNITAALDASLSSAVRLRMMVEGLNPAINGEKTFREYIDLEGKTKDILK